MSAKRYQKGIIPLALLGVAFLTLSLAGVTVVASNPNARLSIDSWAKAKQKSWQDIGNPKARHAGRVDEENRTQQAYQAQKEAVATIKQDNLVTDADKAKLEELQKTIENQSLLTDNQIGTLRDLATKRPPEVDIDPGVAEAEPFEPNLWTTDQQKDSLNNTYIQPPTSAEQKDTLTNTFVKIPTTADQKDFLTNTYVEIPEEKPLYQKIGDWLTSANETTGESKDELINNFPTTEKPLYQKIGDWFSSINQTPTTAEQKDALTNIAPPEPEKPLYQKIGDWFNSVNQTPTTAEKKDSLTNTIPEQGDLSRTLEKPLDLSQKQEDYSPTRYTPNSVVRLEGTNRAEGDVLLTTDSRGNVIKREYVKYNLDGSRDGISSFVATTWNNIFDPVKPITYPTTLTDEQALKQEQASRVQESAFQQEELDIKQEQQQKIQQINENAQLEFDGISDAALKQEQVARMQEAAIQKEIQKFESLSIEPVVIGQTAGKNGQGTGTKTLQSTYTYDPGTPVGAQDGFLGFRTDKFVVTDDNTGQVIDTYERIYRVDEDGNIEYRAIESWFNNAWKDLLGIQ